MTPLSRRGLLAISAVLDVALHARPIPVAARALAARHELPSRHLETVLQALVRRGILKGTRGPRGGYELARERRRISIGDILRAVDLPSDQHAPDLPLLATIVLPVIASASEAFLAALDRITVEDLCQKTDRHDDNMGFHDVGL